MTQRKIGFEFEADMWLSWRRLRNLTPGEGSTPADQRALPLQDLEDTASRLSGMRDANNLAGSYNMFEELVEAPPRPA